METSVKSYPYSDSETAHPIRDEKSPKARNMANAKIALVGGSGFIGSHVAEDLCTEQRAFSRLLRQFTPSSGNNTLKENRQVVDFNNETALRETLKGHDVLINCSADVRLHKSLETYRQTQVELTKRLCHAAATAGVKRVVQLSTVEVYGKATTHALTELDDCKPLYPFQQSCVEREETVKALALQFGMQYTILRPAATFGRRSTYLQFILNQHDKGRFPVIGGGGTRFDAVDTRDIGRAITMLAFEPRAANQTYLLKGYNTSMLEIKAMIDELSGSPSVLRNLPVPIAKTIAATMEILLPYSATPPLSRFAVHAATNPLHYDDAKIRALGFKPLYNLENTFRYALLGNGEC